MKKKLHSYADVINSQWENTGLTIHEILNKATRYREHYGINPDLLKITGIDGQSLTQVKQKELIDQADMLANIYDQVSEQAKDGIIANHYWYGVQNSELKGYQYDGLNSHLSLWTDSLNDLKSYWETTVAEFNMDDGLNTSVADIFIFKNALEKLPELRGDELLSEIEYIYTHQDDFSNMLDSYKTIHHDLETVNKVIKTEHVNNSNTTITISNSIKALQELGTTLIVSLDSISNDISELERLEILINAINKKFDQIRENAPVDLKPCFEVTQNGMHEFSKLIDLINKLPPELWRHREEIFDNPDLDELLSQLTGSLRNLTPIHKELTDIFSLHRLPISSDLIKYKSIIDASGIFRIFSRGWRNAKKSILGLSAIPKPDKKKLIDLLPVLITYTQGIEAIDKLNKEDPLLNDLYRGIETPIDRIVELRQWYQSVRNEYGVGFGDRVSIGNVLINLDRNLVVSIVDVSNQGLLSEVDSSNETLSEVIEKYTELQSLKNDRVQLAGESSPLLQLHNTLSTQMDALCNIVVGQKIDIGSLLSINDKLQGLQKNIAVWFKNEVSQHFVPKILPLSILRF